jgi:hypothetical protein
MADDPIRVTQSGLSIVGGGDPSARVTQVGLVLLATISDNVPCRVTQSGLSVVAKEPKPYLRAVAVSRERIDLVMLPGEDATAHRLYRSDTAPFTPGPTTLIATYGATPAATYQDTGLLAGTYYYYALVAVVDGRDYTAWSAAQTVGMTPPTLYVGAITHVQAVLSVDPISTYLEVEYETYIDGALRDRRSLTGGGRFGFLLSPLSPDTEHVSRARVRYAGGWSEWSDEVTWRTKDMLWFDPDHLGCPPVWSGIHHNPDGNRWDRLGRGFFRPLPGQPLRGASAAIVFRWHHSGVQWRIDLSDDLGETWNTIHADIPRHGTDADRLVQYRTTLNTLGYADGPDYRLRAVSTNLDEPIEWLSMSFHIDNAEEVYWWKAQLGDPETDKWGKLWAQTGETWAGANTGDPIWYRGSDGGLGAIRGHDYALLVDRQIPESYGADVTARWYIFSGEGGFARLQGRDDTEALRAGIGVFAKGASTATKQGLFVGMFNVVTYPLGCCNLYLTSTTASVEVEGRQTPGRGMTRVGPGASDPATPIDKLWCRALKKPTQVIWEETQTVGGYPMYYIPPGTGTGGAYAVWPTMSYRGGPEPGDAVTYRDATCARRWELYSQRTRVEVDPLDKSRIRVRIRFDGPGVVEPETGYWHVDEWVEFPEEWERGTTGICSQQLAMDAYGTPNGARVFYSLSILPLEPDEPPEAPPYEPPPWNPLIEGEPCTVILQVYDEDRETVRWEVGDDTLHPAPFLCVPEHYGEQEIDIINGAATIGQVGVVVIDKAQTIGDQASGWLTERIGRIHGFRNRLLRFISYELGWVVIADGPASAPQLDESYSAGKWLIRDTRDTERKVEVFVEASSSWLLPMGLPDGWGAHINGDGDSDWLVSPQDPLVGTYRILGTTYERGWVDLKDYWPGGWTVHPSPNERPTGSVVVPEEITVLEEIERLFTSPGTPLGNPRPVYYDWPELELLWRASGSADEWTVVEPIDYIVDGESFAKPAGVDIWWPPRKLTRIWDAEIADGTEVRAASWIMLRGLLAEGDFPSDTDEIEIAIRYKGKPSTFAPMHLEGMTTGELLKDLYDGLYSRPDPITGEVVPSGIRYNEADLLEMTDLVLMRITEPVDDLRAWTEKYIYAPTGWVPALNNDGEISPRSQVPPLSWDGLLEVNNDITEPQPEWSAGERIVNVLTLTYPRYYEVDLADADAIDRLASREVSHEFRDESSIDRHAIQAVTYDGSAFAAVGDEFGEPVLTVRDELGWTHADNRRTYILYRYSDGARSIEVPVMRDECATLRAGDWVTLDLSWFPNTETGRRVLSGVGGQVLAIHDVDCAWRILWIEVTSLLPEGS